MKRKITGVSTGKANVFAVVFCGLAALALIAFGLVGWTKGSLENKVTPIALPKDTLQQNDSLPTSILGALNTQPDGKPMNILVLGSDTREGQGTNYGTTADIAGGRSDTTMIVHLAADRRTAVVVSIPRDMVVDIPDCINKDGGTTVSEHKEKFNAAYSIGGPTCTIKTVNMLTGIPINHVVEINFTGFKKIVDSVGGIEVCIKNPINDPNSNLKIDAGQQTVNGEVALGLARARYTLADGSDMARIDRQHVLFEDLIQKVRQENFLTQPKKLYDVLSSSLESISTDEGLKNIPSMASLLLQVKDVPDENIKFVTLPYIDNNDGSTLSLDSKASKTMIKEILADTYVDTVNQKAADAAKDAKTKSPSPSATIVKNVCDNPI